MKTHHHIRNSILGTLIGLSISACTLGGGSPPAPTLPAPSATIQPTTQPSATTLPTAKPATAVPTVASTSTPLPTTQAATAVPTTQAATAVPVDSDSPGPGWVFALESDANLDGVSDKVYYRPASAISETNFQDPRLARIAVAASDIVLVQRSASGLNTMLMVDVHGGRADQPLFDFSTMREPAGYMLALDPAQGPFMNLLPYGAGGVAYELIGIHWEVGAGGFRIVAERPGSDQGQAEAQAVMRSYLTALAEKRYGDAVGLYAGDYTSFANYNPDIAPDDHIALFQRGCEINGFVCLEAISVEPAGVEGDIFFFDITLRAADGSVFTIQPPGNQPVSVFRQVVQRTASGLRVVSLPVYNS